MEIRTAVALVVEMAVAAAEEEAVGGVLKGGGKTDKQQSTGEGRERDRDRLSDFSVGPMVRFPLADYFTSPKEKKAY